MQVLGPLLRAEGRGVVDGFKRDLMIGQKFRDAHALLPPRPMSGRTISSARWGNGKWSIPSLPPQTPVYLRQFTAEFSEVRSRERHMRDTQLQAFVKPHSGIGAQSYLLE